MAQWITKQALGSTEPEILGSIPSGVGLCFLKPSPHPSFWPLSRSSSQNATQKEE